MSIDEAKKHFSAEDWAYLLAWMQDCYSKMWPTNVWRDSRGEIHLHVRPTINCSTRDVMGWDFDMRTAIDKTNADMKKFEDKYGKQAEVSAEIDDLV